ncbi:MAG TPA: DUF4375 domain-containing protein [Haloferula sp.]
MKLLESPLFWIILVALCVMEIVRFLRSRRSRSWGFKDVLKDPDYWDHASNAFEKAGQAEEAAKKWDDAAVDRAVTVYLFETTSSRDAWIESRQLEGLGSRTHRQVLELLADTTRYKQWVTPTGEDILPEAPFNRACDLLGDTPPAEAISLLAPFLDDKDDSIRQEAASTMGKTGSPAMVPHLKKALRDPEQYVRGYALSGLKSAKSSGRLASETAEALFDDVLRLVEKEENGDDSTELLFALDPKRAKEVFLSPAIFRPDSRILHDALTTMANAGISVPRERLLELIEILRSCEIKYPKEYILCQALLLLGRHRHPEDLKLLEMLQGHPDESVAIGASTGILTWHGLQGFEDRLHEREEKSGYASLTRPQQLYKAVFILDAEINNGGLDQYFVNSSGDHWRDALEGLKTMGDLKRAEVLEEAVVKFGNGGPSTERRTRQRQLAAIARKDENAFEALDARYYSKEPIEVIANRYVLANPEAFL